MVIGDSHNKVLEYLKNQGPANTFRLSTVLDIDRNKILDIIQKLKEKGALEFRAGTAKFIKFPTEEKKIVKKKPIEIKKAPPKIIRRTIIKKVPVVKKVYVKPKKLKEQAEYIEKLEKIIKELKQKTNASPKIIRKKIIKKVPVKIKKKPIKRKKPKEKKRKSKKFKFSKINFAKLHKHIRKHHIPKILKKLKG